MGCLQPVEHRRGHAERDAERDELAVLARRAQQLLKRQAVDVLEDEQQLVAVLDDVERRDDVRVRDARGEARLVDEHASDVLLARKPGMQTLDGHRAREADGPEQPAVVDDRHPAGRDLPVERIAADDLDPVAGGRVGHPVQPHRTIRTMKYFMK